MTVTPRDLLKQAEALEKGGTELDARVSIGRAYYAVLHRVRAVIPESFVKDEDEGNSHRRMITAVERYAASISPGRTAAREMLRLLRQLRRTRNDADYFLNINIDNSDAQIAIDRAKRAFAYCDEIEKKQKEDEIQKKRKGEGASDLPDGGGTHRT